MGDSDQKEYTTSLPKDFDVYGQPFGPAQQLNHETRVMIRGGDRVGKLFVPVYSEDGRRVLFYVRNPDLSALTKQRSVPKKPIRDVVRDAEPPTPPEPEPKPEPEPEPEPTQMMFDDDAFKPEEPKPLTPWDID